MLFIVSSLTPLPHYLKRQFLTCKKSTILTLKGDYSELSDINFIFREKSFLLRRKLEADYRESKCSLFFRNREHTIERKRTLRKGKTPCHWR